MATEMCEQQRLYYVCSLFPYGFPVITKHFAYSAAVCSYVAECVNWQHCGGVMAVGICLALECESVM